MKKYLKSGLRYLNRCAKPLEPWITKQAHTIAQAVIIVISGLIIALPLTFVLTIIEHRLLTPQQSASTIRTPAPGLSTEPVTTTTLQRRELAPGTTAHWYNITVKSNDSPILIFKQLGLSIQSLHAILQLGQSTQVLLDVKPGQKVQLLITDQHKLVKLVYRINLTDTLYVTHSPEGFYAYKEHRKLEEKLNYSQATHIHHSLFSTAYQAGLSDNLVVALIDIFGWNIDFAKDLRPKDSFKVMYRAYYLDGNKVRDGKILEAKFTNRGKTYTAIAFTDPTGKTHYYTPQGISLQRPFLRTPVKYTRISSRFRTARYHPILHLIRAHRGVDYAAPYGTPIHTTSDGRITFIGKRGGYGNVIIVEHGKKYSTLYGHMAYFAKGMKKNTRVHQGQVIGYVGKTGLATGTHLHYEFRINGVHHDPLTVKLPAAHPISARYRTAFLKHAKKIMKQFAASKQNNSVIPKSGPNGPITEE